MFNFSQLKQIHLEITNNCQARCPMCSRNYHGGIENPLIKINEWSLEEFKTIISQQVLDQIEQLYFCGNFGDPILNNNIIDMCKHVKQNSNSVSLRLHTNGSLRSSEWWKDLAASMPDDHRVIFGIDGLEDTHSIYRIGTDFNKILNNAKSFIRAGGKAEWVFIVFKHNEHQVEQARQLANKLGFDVFTVKNSSRFIGEPRFPVYDKLGNTEYYLEPPTSNKITFIDKSIVENYKQIVSQSEISCYVLGTKEVYIDAYKNLMPCCFLASAPYNYSPEESLIYPIRKEMLQQHSDLIEELGNVNALEKTIKEIVDSVQYQTVWEKYWGEKKLITCARTCGSVNISKPKDQFIEIEQL